MFKDAIFLKGHLAAMLALPSLASWKARKPKLPGNQHFRDKLPRTESNGVMAASSSDSASAEPDSLRVSLWTSKAPHNANFIVLVAIHL